MLNSSRLTSPPRDSLAPRRDTTGERAMPRNAPRRRRSWPGAMRSRMQALECMRCRGRRPTTNDARRELRHVCRHTTHPSSATPSRPRALGVETFIRSLLPAAPIVVASRRYRPVLRCQRAAGDAPESLQPARTGSIAGRRRCTVSRTSGACVGTAGSGCCDGLATLSSALASVAEVLM